MLKRTLALAAAIALSVSALAAQAAGGLRGRTAGGVRCRTASGATGAAGCGGAVTARAALTAERLRAVAAGFCLATATACAAGRGAAGTGTALAAVRVCVATVGRGLARRPARPAACRAGRTAGAAGASRRRPPAARRRSRSAGRGCGLAGVDDTGEQPRDAGVDMVGKRDDEATDHVTDHHHLPTRVIP